MRRECPNGHPTVVRNDPRSTGQIAMCDVCGWEASYIVVRDEADWQPADNHHAEQQLTRESEQRQLAAPSGKRRGDS